MITLPKAGVEVKELIKVEEGPIKATTKKNERPYVLNARVYKLKSVFVDSAVYVTITYIEEEGKKRPFEIFINSKDLTRAAEYSVLTRLISAIFRRSEDPTFILEELKSIYDPNGGRMKNGRYLPSFYAEIADVLEEFFADIGLIKKRENKLKKITLFSFGSSSKKDSEAESQDPSDTPDDNLRICPKCGQRTLKVENGCMTCINPDCGYSKCDD